jgi:hypothetical protein
MHQQRDVEAGDLEDACKQILAGDWDNQVPVAEWQGPIVRWDNASAMEEQGEEE